MSEENKKIVPAMPVNVTPGGTLRVDDSMQLLLEESASGLRFWRPPTTPVVTRRKPASPSLPGPSDPTKRSRRSLGQAMRDADIENVLGNLDSGSEDDNSSDDEDDDRLGIIRRNNNMHQVARKLRDYNIILDEQQPEALAEFLHGEMVDDNADVDLIERHAQVPSEVAGDISTQTAGSSGGVERPALDSFTWSEDFTTFSGQEEEYLRTAGPQVAVTEPVALFQEVWDRTIVQKIVEETNRYAWQTITQISETGSISKSLDAWRETTVDEIYRLFVIINYMSLCYRARIDEYWTTGVLGMPDFRSIMSRNRYILLLRFLHFIDNSTVETRSYDRKISKITPILNHCNNKFRDMYTPQRSLSLDESLLLWKGRLSWVQCIRSKAARFGIKSFELCEAESGYLLRTLLYAGKDSSFQQGAIDGFGNPTAKVVLELMDGYLDVGHLLVMDNWYNQLSLTRHLKRRHTDVIGTMNRRRTHVPEAIKCANESRMPRGAQLAQHCGDISIASWKDVKLVTAISTFHNAEQVGSQRAGVPTRKPVMIEAYNKHMGGVDLKDQKLSMFFFERKRGMKWYVKVFRRLLNTSLMNTFILYRKQPVLHVYTHRQFRYKVAEGLLSIYQPVHVARPLALPVTSDVRLDRQPDHYPVPTELVEGKKEKHARRRCTRCTAAGKRTQGCVMCSKCKVPLCIGQCWIDYHTLDNLLFQIF